MIGNEILAIVIGYLLGSIPSAYIAARVVKGKDIRQIGSSNIGAVNTFREVGIKAGLAVTITDIGKGTAAVAIAYWLLDVSQLFVLAAALAAIVGHNWMVFLKFSGGKGMATTIGAIAILMPLYDYWAGLLIFFVIIAMPLIITRNIALSLAIGLVSLPFIIWLGMESGPLIVWSIVIGILIGLRFLPTARAAWARAENKRDFFFEHRQRNKE
ncbi:Glycerol-3-phosphate acyltransferase [subsurface metagenome]